MKRAACFLFSVYAAAPVILYLLPWILGHVIFCHFLKFPFSVDLSRPADVLNHTCNFYLSPEEGVSVGVWHTLPASQWEGSVGRGPEWYREALGDGRPVIIYLHGNLGTRAIHHRVELVKILSAAGYHVLSLDYRGFGDSTGEPSEEGLTRDALCLHDWVLQHSRGASVALWGHSLGSGVATNTAVQLQDQGSAVDAVILEAAFTTIGEVVAIHPVTKMYMFLPGFESLIWSILNMNNIVFASDKNLETVSSPLLILHSEDDHIVPYQMGLKLYEISLQAQKQYKTDVQVEMISYSADLGYSHNNIYLDPNLTNRLGNFLQTLRK
ncbi:lysophosphatidylserine lipase ABHD12-like [Trematomus bernacchii]|nr:lysophosphatidylserine lipase ABHD12-like [Trematomus bernacchii]